MTADIQQNYTMRQQERNQFSSLCIFFSTWQCCRQAFTFQLFIAACGVWRAGWIQMRPPDWLAELTDRQRTRSTCSGRWALIYQEPPPVYTLSPPLSDDSWTRCCSGGFVAAVWRTARFRNVRRVRRLLVGDGRFLPPDAGCRLVQCVAGTPSPTRWRRRRMLRTLPPLLLLRCVRIFSSFRFPL